MAGRLIGDVVLPIPYPGGTRYQRVGGLLQHDNNDPAKGPGFSVVLDRWFSPAGAPQGPGGYEDSVFLSVYHPKQKEVRNISAPPFPKPAPKPTFDGDDDDLPF